jgi:sugar (pentulose or hexulose) kinase
VRHLARALLEGIAFRFKNLHGVLTEIGVDAQRVIASGGFTKSGLSGQQDHSPVLLGSR